MQESGEAKVRCKIDPAGRVLIPAEIRQQMHIAPGDEVILEVSRGHLTVSTFQSVVREIRQQLASYATPGVSIVDELIAERRAEAERE